MESLPFSKRAVTPISLLLIFLTNESTVSFASIVNSFELNVPLLLIALKVNLEPLAKPVKSVILLEPVATIVDPTPCADFAN